MKFSVLISIYHKEKPEYFDRCLQSIWDEQSLRPDEIILVQDGPLNNELYLSIDKWRNKLGKKLTIVSLEKNVGLGDALNIGLDRCTCDIVARMDTDDISTPDRFEKQIGFLKEHPEMTADIERKVRLGFGLEVDGDQGEAKEKEVE